MTSARHTQDGTEVRGTRATASSTQPKPCAFGGFENTYNALYISYIHLIAKTSCHGPRCLAVLLLLYSTQCTVPESAASHRAIPRAHAGPRNWGKLGCWHEFGRRRNQAQLHLSSAADVWALWWPVPGFLENPRPSIILSARLPALSSLLHCLLPETNRVGNLETTRPKDTS